MTEPAHIAYILGMSSHPITGTTDINLADRTRRLAFDMNCAAALHESKGDQWNDWLVKRFLGITGDSTDVTPLTPVDSITVLHALLATDREDAGTVETEKDLRRAVSPAELPHLQLAMLKVVLAGFGLPGEDVASILDGVGAGSGSAAAGTGPGPLRSPSVRSASRRTVSGG